MSVRIGEIKSGSGQVLASVSASLGGIEMTDAAPHYSLQPTEARNAAALLVRAGDECERMRRCEDRGSIRVVEPVPTPPIYLGQRVVVDAGSQKGQAGAVQGIMRWLGESDTHYVLLDSGKVVCTPYVKPEFKEGK